MCKKCGCNTCETESTMLVLNESKAPATILSEGLKHHIDTNKPLTEHLYRAGSRAYFDLFAEARSLYSRGILEFTHKDDIALLTETNLGHFGLYETVNFEGEEYDIISKDGDWVYLRSIHDTQVGRKEIKVKEKDITINETKVPLDFPIELNEQMDIYDDVANMEFGMDYDQLGSNEKEWVRDEIDNMSINEEVEIKKSIKDIEDGDVILYKGKKFKVDYIDPWSAGGRILNLTDLKSSKKGKLKVKFVTPKGNTGTASDTMLTVLKESVDEAMVDYDFSKEELIRVIKQLKRGASTEVGMIKAFEKALGRELTDNEIRGFKLNEAKNKKKKDNRPIGKPMRSSSGGKAYKVYVRDPKTKKIKTVRFGSGGLRAKINDSKARSAFAKRHKCSQKKDRTKASYWSCRLPRYAKLLGLKSSFSGFW